VRPPSKNWKTWEIAPPQQRRREYKREWKQELQKRLFWGMTRSEDGITNNTSAGGKVKDPKGKREHNGVGRDA